MVNELQGDESIYSKVEPQEGKRNGLRLFLDLQSNTLSLGTLERQQNTFKLFISESAQFLMIRDKNIPVQPGREHFVDLSATNKIRHISPERG